MTTTLAATPASASALRTFATADSALVNGPAPVAVEGPDQARDLVALHVAAATHATDLAARERTRTAWAAALSVVWDQHPDWAVVYLPGLHHDDNDTYAVHKPTGRVVGGECVATRPDSDESTASWLTRLTAS